jgi:hypothetical protein
MVVVAMLRTVSMMIVMTSEFVSMTKTDDMASSELLAEGMPKPCRKF